MIYHNPSTPEEITAIKNATELHNWKYVKLQNKHTKEISIHLVGDCISGGVVSAEVTSVVSTPLEVVGHYGIIKSPLPMYIKTDNGHIYKLNSFGVKYPSCEAYLSLYEFMQLNNLVEYLEDV